MFRRSKEGGQSLLEFTAGAAFLLLSLLVLFEFAIIFFAYLNVLSAARAGCLYASGRPDWLRRVQQPGYNPALDPDYQQYYTRIYYEAQGAGLDTRNLRIHLPEMDQGVGAGKPVKVKVDYELSTFFSTVELPWFGRFGLPNRYRITAQVTMPIRGE
ncbi:MAG: hypothetical protein RMK30_02450 [Anaerolineae bacterium]|nr:hypothetical protein [Anaerolineae bacterium]